MESPQSSPTAISTEKLDFPTALYQVINGQKITKLEWKNEKIYLVLKDARLMIHKKDNSFYPLIVSEGDLIGQDWIVIL